MVVPNEKAVYGSASRTVSLTNLYDTNTGNIACSRWRKYHQVIYITKTHAKALDQPSQRCTKESLNITTNACINNYLEKNLGCNPMVLGSQFSKTPKCTTKKQLQALANLTKQFQRADENDIYELTGCLPSCTGNRFSLTVDPLQSEIEIQSQCQMHLEFIMVDSSYKEEEQYVIYDVDSFIADVGGFMGLLLGSSLLSLYMAMEACVRKLLNGSLKSKIDT